MYKKGIGSLCVLIILVGLIGCTTDFNQPAPNTPSLLWEISGNGSNKPSYLFGTIGVGSLKSYEWNDSVLPKMRQCDVFAMELILDSLNKITVGQGLAPDSGKLLKDMLSEQDYADLENIVLQLTEQPLSRYQLMSPILLYGALTAQLSNQDATISNGEILFNKARVAHKQLLSLETPEEQIADYKKYPNAFMINLLRDVEGMREEDKQKVEAYLAKDFDRYMALTHHEKFWKEHDQVTIYNKTKRYAANIIKQLQQPVSTFFAIDLQFIVGEQGVVNALKEAGYTVRPLVAPVTQSKLAIDNEGWIKFTDDHNTIEAWFPGIPSEGISEYQSDHGAVTQHYFSMTKSLSTGKDNTVYYISIHEYPNQLDFAGDTAKLHAFFEEQFQNIFEQVDDAKLVEEKPLQTGPLKGRFYAIQYYEDLLTVFNFYWVDNHLFILQLGTSADNFPNKEGTKFLQSFKVLSQTDS